MIADRQNVDTGFGNTEPRNAHEARRKTHAEKQKNGGDLRLRRAIS